MNHALLAALVIVVIVIGSALTIMNKPCKSSHHAWCAPISTVRHHTATQGPT
jgi:hypothetical protein